MKYIGEELDLFQHAVNWKRYYSTMLKPHVRGAVLDAGCGMGVNAEYLINPAVTRYTFLEPDAALLAQVDPHVKHPLLKNGRRVQGTTESLKDERFDAILYLDVIEHIEDSKAELARARDMLNPGGSLLIVVPALMMLYSPFDAAIGHYRRYTKRLLRSELPEGMRVETMRYLDAPGMLMSLGNKLLLKQGSPKLNQILFWDRTVVPCAKVLDKVVLHSFGRSLMAVVKREG